jgi:hypothetical protein
MHSHFVICFHRMCLSSDSRDETWDQSEICRHHITRTNWLIDRMRCLVHTWGSNFISPSLFACYIALVHDPWEYALGWVGLLSTSDDWAASTHSIISSNREKPLTAVALRYYHYYKQQQRLLLIIIIIILLIIIIQSGELYSQLVATLRKKLQEEAGESLAICGFFEANWMPHRRMSYDLCRISWCIVRYLHGFMMHLRFTSLLFMLNACMWMFVYYECKYVCMYVCMFVCMYVYM